MTATYFTCRSCGGKNASTFIDLGLSPLANSYVAMQDAATTDAQYPLHARVCNRCFLVQVDDVVPAADIFDHDYAYFSSFSDSWLEHCKGFAASAAKRYKLGQEDLVMEIASNDGYLLQYFKANGIQVLGIEPTGNTAAVAIEKNIPTRVEFFTEQLAHQMLSEGIRPSLICSANVLAHVPDIGDFVRGVGVMLDGDAVYTVEFPQLLSLINDSLFDTIYHEHFSYLSLYSTERVFDTAGLRVFDVETLATHGGSLRIHACLKTATHTEHHRVAVQRALEAAANLDNTQGYLGFADRVDTIRKGLTDFLDTAARDGRRVAAYGAAAKGNTLLNFCGINSDAISYVVDKNPAKQNKLLPGSRIPVREVQALYDDPVDDVLILPWNIKDEIVTSLSDLQSLGTRFFVATPSMAQVD